MATILEADHLARLRALVDTATLAETAVGNITMQIEIVNRMALSRTAQQDLIAAMGDDGAKRYMEDLLAYLDTVVEKVAAMAKGVRSARRGGDLLAVGLRTHYGELLGAAPAEPEHDDEQQESARPRGKKREPKN